MNDSHTNFPPVERSVRQTANRQFWLVATCFLISGFAALLYETVWLRQFAILLGTSEQALAVVLASYMGGLAIGSLTASRFVDTVRRPLLTYGLLECGIALSALFVPLGIAFSSSIQASVLGGNPEPPDAGGIVQVAFCLGTAFGLILIPTALMGATLPLLARHVVSNDQELGPKIGLLYAINTAGAVIGTIVAAFVCLPTLGLGRTTWVGVAANFLVFLIVLMLVRGRSDTLAPTQELTASPDGSSTDSEPTENQSQRNIRRSKQPSGKNPKALRRSSQTPAAEWVDDGRYRWILAFAALSGGVSFCYEILFTRMLGQLLGGSVYAFATMLSGFLLGIALGGGIASRLTTTRRNSAKWFIYAQAGAGVCTLITYHLVNAMVIWPWHRFGDGSAMLMQVVASILALLPTSTLIGATFPLAIRIYARNEREAASSAARVYFWNVFGGIIGAMATGMLILPKLQYHGATALAILMNLMIAVAVCGVLKVNRAHLLVPAIALGLLVIRWPSAPENVLRVSALSGKLTGGKILFNHVGRSATVTVFRNQGEILFQTNGLPESQLQMLGSGEIHRYSGYWLSALPAMIRPQCKSMLIIGLGGGVAAEWVPPSIDSIDIMEIEPAVVDANRAVADQRNHDPLSDPRVRLILNDGRNALALTDKKYDAIVSQPSHPWTAGASHLYSREFDELVRKHLNPGGVFLQWMDSDFVDVELTRSIGATLLDVFPHARMYQPISGVMMFVASDRRIEPESVPATGHGQTWCDVNPQDREIFQRLGVVTPTHLFSKLTLDEQGLRQVSDGAALITDEKNLLAMRAPHVMRAGNGSAVRFYLKKHMPLSRSMETAERLCPSLDLKNYLLRLTNYHNREWVQQVGLPLMKNPSERATVEAMLGRVSGSLDSSLSQMRRLAAEFPANSDLAFELISNQVLGADTGLSKQEASALRSALTPRHQLAIDLLEKLMAGDWLSARARDAELAGWPVDDVAYQVAVRLRLPWRLESPPAERVARCNEAIEIIDLSAPFANSAGLAYFRVAAAVNANRPHAALSTTASLTQMIKRSTEQQDQLGFAAGMSNLVRCYGILRDPNLFRSVSPELYREVLVEVENVLSGLSQGGQG
jgi:spermidine synthase